MSRVNCERCASHVLSEVMVDAGIPDIASLCVANGAFMTGCVPDAVWVAIEDAISVQSHDATGHPPAVDIPEDAVFYQ